MNGTAPVAETLQMLGEVGIIISTLILAMIVPMVMQPLEAYEGWSTATVRLYWYACIITLTITILAFFTAWTITFQCAICRSSRVFINWLVSEPLAIARPLVLPSVALCCRNRADEVPPPRLVKLEHAKLELELLLALLGSAAAISTSGGECPVAAVAAVAAVCPGLTRERVGQCSRRFFFLGVIVAMCAAAYPHFTINTVLTDDEFYGSLGVMGVFVLLIGWKFLGMMQLNTFSGIPVQFDWKGDFSEIRREVVENRLKAIHDLWQEYADIHESDDLSGKAHTKVTVRRQESFSGFAGAVPAAGTARNAETHIE